MGDGDEELGERGGIFVGLVRQEKIDVVGGDDSTLRGFRDLDDRQ